MKFFKKIMAIAISCCMLSTVAFAANSDVPEEQQDWGDPIQVNQFIS